MEMDYCSAILCSIADNLHKRLHLVQNAAARLNMQTDQREVRLAIALVAHSMPCYCCIQAHHSDVQDIT